MPATVDPRPWRDLGPEVATALGGRLDQVVGQLAAGVAASVPEFAEPDDSRLRRDILESVTVALERFVSLVGTDQPALPPDVREVYVGLGAAEARENRGPQVVTSALRAGARLLLRETAEAVRSVAPLHPDQVLLIADAANAFTDELVAACTEGYAQQVRDAAGESDRRRIRLAELLLAGGAAPSVVAQAAAEAGWDDLASVTPVLLSSGDAREARFRFADDGVVLERDGHAVALVRRGSRSDADLLGARLARRWAVIGPTVAWTAVPEAVHLTRRTADLAGPDEKVSRVADHVVALTLRGEPTAAAALVDRRLGPLLALADPQRTQLLDTLASWLRNWGARAAVADELVVHPQTVSYRIRRVRELLGPELDDPTVRFELAVALAVRTAAPSRS